MKTGFRQALLAHHRYFPQLCQISFACYNRNMDGSFIISPLTKEAPDVRLELLAELENTDLLMEANAIHLQTVLTESREALDQVV